MINWNADPFWEREREICVNFANAYRARKDFASSAFDSVAFTWPALRPVSPVSRIDRCIHYSGAKSFVNNGLHESLPVSRSCAVETIVCHVSPLAPKERLNNAGVEDFSPHRKKLRYPLWKLKLRRKKGFKKNLEEKKERKDDLNLEYP